MVLPLTGAGFSSPAYIAKVLRYNPTAYWPLIEQSGTTAACRVNAAQNGTFARDVSVMGTQAGPDGNTAPTFDATNDYVNCLSATLQGAFSSAQGTLMAWLKVSGAGVWTDGTGRRAAMVYSDFNNWAGLGRSAANNTLQFFYRAGGVYSIVNVAGLSSIDWLCTLITWSAGDDEVRAYINGAPADDTTGLGVWAGGLARALIGAYDTVPSNAWTGGLAHVAYWNSTLTPIQAGYVSDKLMYAYDPDFASADRAAAPLVTPTSDGTGEATHPSVYDAGAGNTWSGYRYWMAMTPYPNGDGTVETPEILASSDGDTWVVPPGLTNPIQPGVLNADTELLMVGDTLYCVWFNWDDSPNCELHERHSTDGITWSADVIILSKGPKGANAELMSPALVYDDGTFKLWTLDNTRSPAVIRYRTANAITGPWSSPTDCTFTPVFGSAPDNFWHGDVVKVRDRYFLVYSVGPPGVIGYGGDNYLAISYDGMSWHLSATPIIEVAPGAWDQRIYRSTLVWNGAGFDMWYGGRDCDAPEAWRIGRTTVTWPWLV